MNWTYNELGYVWLELDYIFEVPLDDICCDLVLYKYNWTELNLVPNTVYTQPQKLYFTGGVWYFYFLFSAVLSCFPQGTESS